MSHSILLYSSHEISDEELTEVILQNEGILTKSSPMGYIGGLIDGDAHIYVSRIPCYDGVDGDEEAMIVVDQAKAMLGAEFQTWLHIQLGHDAGSGLLGVRFAHACCQRWPCVVDEYDNLFSCKEITEIFEEEKTFNQYTLQRRGL